MITKNKISIIVLIILLIIPLYLCINIEIKKKYNNNPNYPTDMILCENMTNYEGNDFCTNLGSGKDINNKDTLSVFYEIVGGPEFYIFHTLAPILIIIAGTYNIFKKFKSQNYKNNLTRQSYYDYIKKILLDSYKNILILPIVIIFLFMISYFISGHFDYSYVVQRGISSFPIIFLKKPLIFMIIYITNLLFISLFYISLGLIIIRKNKNYLISMLETMIVYYGINIINEFLIISLIFGKIFKIDIESYIDFFDMYSYQRDSLIGITITCVILGTISCLYVVKIYNNKEKNILKLEKTFQ